jgi:hypothetical protein
MCQELILRCFLVAFSFHIVRPHLHTLHTFMSIRDTVPVHISANWLTIICIAAFFRSGFLLQIAEAPPEVGPAICPLLF